MHNIAAGDAARFALLDVLQGEVAIFGPSTPGQTRTPNEENGIPERDFFSGLIHITYALWIVLRIADRGTEEAAAQQQQHSSSSTAAVVAATSRLRTKRTSVDKPVSLSNISGCRSRVSPCKQ